MAYLVKQEASKKWWITTKYLCVPCGYIYDEALGDPDGGLPPGTKFADIPDGRVCPVCGVSKASFEPYYDADSTTEQTLPIDTTPSGYTSKVVNCVMLTPDVVELSLALDAHVNVLAGHHAALVLKDFDGEFTRMYSVVSYQNNIITFRIKIKETGRGGRVLKQLKVWTSIKIKTIWWNFLLKNTSNPKVFIATGTGIAPLYNMIMSNTFSQNTMLFWWVRAKEDVFYADKLTTLPNTTSLFFLSQQEDATPYQYGRVHTDNYNFPLETEFYLCGNKAMVLEQMASLKARGYKNVYVEIF